MRNRSIILIAATSVLLGAAVENWHHNNDAPAPRPITHWRRSDRTPPPIATPFVGAYVEDGALKAEVELHYGDQYWEYAPTLKPPIGASFGSAVPVWWSEAPGEAE